MFAWKTYGQNNQVDALASFSLLSGQWIKPKLKHPSKRNKFYLPSPVHYHSKAWISQRQVKIGTTHVFSGGEVPWKTWLCAVLDDCGEFEGGCDLYSNGAGSLCQASRRRLTSADFRHPGASLAPPYASTTRDGQKGTSWMGSQKWDQLNAFSSKRDELNGFSPRD